jgi:hypothetical protein
MNITITPEILKLIADIDEFKGHLAEIIERDAAERKYDQIRLVFVVYSDDLWIVIRQARHGGDVCVRWRLNHPVQEHCLHDRQKVMIFLQKQLVFG